MNCRWVDVHYAAPHTGAFICATCYEINAVALHLMADDSGYIACCEAPSQKALRSKQPLQYSLASRGLPENTDGWPNRAAVFKTSSTH